MTDDLDTLRPEVREAVGRMVVLCSAANKTGKWVRADCDVVIVAELLRLEAESAGNREDAYFWKERAKKAEAELAALKARIADAPVATAFERAMWKVDFNQRTTYIDVPWPFTEQIGGVGQRVRLVVEE